MISAAVSFTFRYLPWIVCVFWRFFIQLRDCEGLIGVSGLRSFSILFAILTFRWALVRFVCSFLLILYLDFEGFSILCSISLGSSNFRRAFLQILIRSFVILIFLSSKGF